MQEQYDMCFGTSDFRSSGLWPCHWVFAEFPRRCCGLISKDQNPTFSSSVRPQKSTLTLNPLKWKIWWAPNNASRWQIGFNSAFKGFMSCLDNSKTTYPVIRCQVLEQRTLQMHCWEKFKPRRLWCFCSRLHGVISPKIPQISRLAS